MRKIYFLGIVIILFASNLKAQDPQFSQFYANPVYLNPAFTGTTHLPKVHLNFRDQWPGINHAYVTISASYDQYFSDINSGIGLYVLSDKAGNGLLNTNTIALNYSYQLQLGNKLALKVGLQPKWTQKRVDWEQVYYPDQIDPVTGYLDNGNNTNPTNEPGGNRNSVSNLDLASGALLFSEHFFAGIAIDHMIGSRFSFTDGAPRNIPVRLTTHFGGKIKLSDDDEWPTYLSPNVLFSMQDQANQIVAGGYLKTGPLLGGASFRYSGFNNSDALILSAGYQLELLTISYSFDLSTSTLHSNSGGAHELALILNLDQGEFFKVNKGRYLKCPSLYF